MDQASFRAFYERTSPALVAYLSSLTGNRAAAEELMQECYLRMLKANLPESMDDHHLRNYVFRIGANLAKDRFRLMRHRARCRKWTPLLKAVRSAWSSVTWSNRLLFTCARKTGNSSGSLTSRKLATRKSRL